MNTKQQLATGFLALVIVGSVTFMPVSAGQKDSTVAAPRAQATTIATLNTAAPLNAAELPQDQVKDLTYN